MEKIDSLASITGIKLSDMLGKEEKVNCSICEDKGFIEKTEWSGTDDSYDVAVRCQCSED
jgi:hypothetical protein